MDHAGTSYIVDLDVSPDGRYFVSAKDSEAGLVVWKLPTSARTDISDTPAPASFTVSHYPNPVKDRMVLVIDAPYPAEASLQVYDLLGRRVMSRPEIFLTSYQQEVRIDAVPLVAGIYIFQLVVQTPNKPFIYRGRMVKL